MTTPLGSQTPVPLNQWVAVSAVDDNVPVTLRPDGRLGNGSWLPEPSSAPQSVDPQWLTEGLAAAQQVLVDADGWCGAEPMIRAALPILRAGIEAELRLKLAAEVSEMNDLPSPDPNSWLRGYGDALDEVHDLVLGTERCRCGRHNGGQADV